MGASREYSVVVAPFALAQMEAALLWWARNRHGAPDLLMREIDAAWSLLAHAPHAGRRVSSKHFKGVRRLLLRRAGYHVDYQVVEPAHEVRVVHFRHARRRPRP